MTIVVVLAAIAAISAACIPPPEETTPEVVVTASTLTVGYGDEIPALDPSYGAITPTVEATCSTTATQGSPAGDYPTTCEGALRSGHTIRYIAGTLTIAPAAVTVTASDATMDFGGSVPAITATYSGLVGITEPAVLATCSTEATSTSTAGSYASSCEGASDPNHSFTYVDGTVTVGAVPVVVTASSASMTYGDDAAEILPTYSGLLNGDTAPATAPTCGTDATPASGVGTYASSCSGAADPSYTFTYVDGSVAVWPAPAMVTASSTSVAFGEEIPAITPSYSGLVNGDTEPATAPTCSTTATTGAPSGTYESTCVGAADPNYTFGYTNGAVTIVAGSAPVTLTASSATITYGDAVPAITASYDGFTGGQTEPATAPTCSTTATTSSDAGTYPTTCVGAADPNHVITVVEGSITILPAAATVTASSESSAYGAAIAAVTPVYSGLVNGDTAAATAPTCSTTATSASDAGSYTTSCVGAADPNYSFDAVDGAYTVTPAAATVTASSATITEGDEVPEITATYGGFVNGDVAPATAATCSTTATSASAPGTYATTCAGAADPNYTFTSVDGTITVEAAVEPEPEVAFTGLSSYQVSVATSTIAAGTNGGGTNLPRGTVAVASTAGFSTWTNLTVQSANGPQSVFCNGLNATNFLGCSGGTGATPTGGYVSNAAPNRFNVYSLAGGAAAVSPSSLTILEDVPEAFRLTPSTVTADANHGVITFIQSGAATGEFTLRFGICDAGTATYSAEDPACSIGEILYKAPSIARIAGSVTVSGVTQHVYNQFPVAIEAPDQVTQGEQFNLSWSNTPGSTPSRQDTSAGTATVNYLTRFATYIPIPAGVTYVPGSARLVGGDAWAASRFQVIYCTTNGGECDASQSGNFDATTSPYLKLFMPDTTANRVTGGSVLSQPTITADFVATGAPGSSATFSMTQYRNVTNATVTIIFPITTNADFRGFPSESAVGGAPTKSVPRNLHTITID